MLRFAFLSAVSNVVAAAALLAFSQTTEAQLTSTVTKLSVTSNATAVTTVPSKSAVRLTATVNSAGGAQGRVRFCDLSANSACRGVALLGVADLSTTSVAQLDTYLTAGVHTLQVQYIGTQSYAASVSPTYALEVGQPTAPSIVLTSAGAVGNYTLKAVLASTGAASAAAGTVEFRDVSKANALIRSVAPARSGLQWFAAASVIPRSTVASDSDGIPFKDRDRRGDFNRDGTLDYISIDPVVRDGKNQTDATLHLGLGNGEFKTAQTFPSVRTVSMGDFDGDGLLDLLAEGEGTATIFYGAGNGSFSSPVAIANFSGNGCLADDLNRDGITDLVCGAQTYLATASRSFTTVPSGISDAVVALVDLDGDGNLDAVVATTGNGAAVPYAVRSGHGDGTFGKVTPLTSATMAAVAGDISSKVFFADVDGDGVTDMILVRAVYATQADLSAAQQSVLLNVYRGLGNGTFAATATSSEAVPLDATQDHFFAIADQDHDGVADVVVTRTQTSSWTAFSLTSEMEAVSAGVAMNDTSSHEVKAIYSVPQGGATVTSNSVFLQGGNEVPVVSITSSAMSVAFGSPVTFTASVASSAAASATDGEKVTFRNGTSVLGSGVLKNGSASITLNNLQIGTYYVIAGYAGGSRLQAASSAPLTITVGKAAPVVQWDTPSAINFGLPLSAVQLNATAVSADGATVPGTFVYAPAAGTVLTPGTRTLSVTFTPDDASRFAPAIGMVNLVVNKAPATVSIARTWPTSSSIGTATTVTLSATVASPAGTPSGSVIFFDGANQIGTSAVVSGAAKITTTFASTGTHNLTATYSGDDLFTAATSTPLSEQVASANVNVQATPSAITVRQGGTASSALLVTPSGNFAGKVELSCGNLPALATCSFSSAALSFSGDNAAQSTVLTVTTHGPGSAQTTASVRQLGNSGMALAALVGLPLFAAGFARRRRLPIASLLGVVLVTLLAGVSTGCGIPSSVTPTGTSSIQVMAQVAGATAQSQAIKIDVTVVQ